MVLRALAGTGVLGVLFALATLTLHAADQKPDEYVQLIVKLINDKDSEFRAAGLEQVRTAALGAQLTQLFAAQLAQLDAEGQIALLAALADRGDRTARSAVLELLASSKDEGVRAAAIGSLGGLGGSEDLPLLINALARESSMERSAARVSLTQISGETINRELAADLNSASPGVKAELVGVLATRRAADALPAFVAATVDENAEVREAAMSALGEIGRPEQIPQMLPGVLKAEKGAERSAAEQNVAMVCRRIGNAGQRGDALINALKTVDAAQRDQLLSLAGRVGGEKLSNFVGEIATGKDTSRRRLGIDALSKWPDATVADKLLEIANQTADPAERRIAFQGFVRVSATRDKRPDTERLARMKQALQAAKSPEEVTLVIKGTRTSYDIESMRLVLPYVDQPQFAQMACETIVEISHHREVRDPNKAEVDQMLDKVIAVSKDPVVVDRANRYKRGETWVRPR